MRSYVTKMAGVTTLPPREEREAALAEAGYNVFNLDSENVFVDLLTDSGTGTMSDAQWAAMLEGDEAYAGSDSFDRLQAAVQDVMGFEQVVPTHQGRGAENVLYGTLVSEGDHVLNNTHFDTTRAHVAANGGVAVDCPVDSAESADEGNSFDGNFSVERAREHVDDVGADAVPVVVLTITNNSNAGQPVSVENTRAVREFADEIDATFVIDACRFAENAYFVREREGRSPSDGASDEAPSREPGYEDASIQAIAREQLGLADAVVMSGKKDGIANIGGFAAMRDPDLFEHCKQRAILYEGFPTYGGMAGRDLAALAVGLREAVELPYLEHRIGQVRELAGLLRDAEIPIVEPVGGHAVYVDAGAFFPAIPSTEFPGQALVCELYREGGVRAVELGSFAFPDTDRPEYVRLALPRRTYHREHIEHVAETVEAVFERRDEVSGYEIVDEPPIEELRHFSARLEPVAE
ncbi:tryptophanase [Halorientalis brevis]|uniref:Tryptophanase n=1 Tax=Halorientalis brevis TaxID=1126241 RepID=A0ABD6C895_9EURY|nr:tryptophanase [Halorientalis brevis]